MIKHILKWFGISDMSSKPMEPLIFGTPGMANSRKVRVAPEDVIAMTQELNRKIEAMGLGPKSKKSQIKIAVDESVGRTLANKIEAKGYKIVARAGHAETDESWMKRALKEGALFIISPDLDIPSMIERENLPMVWIDFLFATQVYPQLNVNMTKEEKHAIWSQYLHDRIQAKIRFLGKEFGGPND